MSKTKFKEGDKVTSWKGNIGECGEIVGVIKSPMRGVIYEVELNGNRGKVYDKAKAITLLAELKD